MLHLEETKQKMSESHKGMTPWNKGKVGVQTHSEETRKKMSEVRKGKIPWNKGLTKEIDERVKNSGEKRKGQEPWNKGKTGVYSEEIKVKMSEGQKKFWNEIDRSKIRKENSSRWQGGYYQRNEVSFDQKAHLLEQFHEVRRNEERPDILEVRCAHPECRNWFKPTYTEVKNRIAGINGSGGKNLYCSQGCKDSCPVYGKSYISIIKLDHFNYIGILPDSYKEVIHPELRKMVLERDNYTCQKCSTTEHLNCHHINPVISSPVEANDLDNCITLCIECHKWIHMNIPGCGYAELRCSVEEMI